MWFKKSKQINVDKKSMHDLTEEDRSKEWRSYSILSFEYYDREKKSKVGENHEYSKAETTC